MPEALQEKKKTMEQAGHGHEPRSLDTPEKRVGARPWVASHTNPATPTGFRFRIHPKTSCPGLYFMPHAKALHHLKA